MHNPNDLNARIAAILGYPTVEVPAPDKVCAHTWIKADRYRNPAQEECDAVWTLGEYCANSEYEPVLEYSPTIQGWWCYIYNPKANRNVAVFCEAICRAILYTDAREVMEAVGWD